MSLCNLWQNSRDQIETKQINQIVAIAGDGKLQDASSASLEFREFLRIVPAELIESYLIQCLQSSFSDSGFALQDIVNEIGHRLGFRVENGRYRGTNNELGNDGLWIFPDGHSVVVEVKTTDAYRIDSDTIADYRKRLIDAKRIQEEKSSILIVVGRQDTGDLEAQIRGSRHAWDIRIISMDALLRLMHLKLSIDDPQIIRRICAILIPKEFTRLDEIVEIAFFAAEESSSEKEALELSSKSSDVVKNSETTEKTSALPVAFHEQCMDKLSKKLSVPLVRQRKTGYVSVNEEIAAVCAVSKVHEGNNFWFGFHPHQRDYLESHSEGYLVLGCGSSEITLAIPYKDLKPMLESFWTTENEDRMYWHIRIQNDGKRLSLNRRKGYGNLDASKYILK